MGPYLRGILLERKKADIFLSYFPHQWLCSCRNAGADAAWVALLASGSIAMDLDSYC